MALICLAGDAQVLKDEYVKNLCEKEKLQRIPVDSSQAEKAFAMLQQANFLIPNCLIDVVDFDDWKKSEKDSFIKEAVKNPSVKVVIRTLQPIKDVETVLLELPKPWQDEEWLEYTKKRFAKHGLKFDEKAVRKFLKLTGFNDLVIEREIEKLSNVGQFVDEELVEKITFDYSKAQIDELCFAISSLNKVEAFKLAKGCFEEYEPILICAALAKHFLDLFKVIISVQRKSKYTWPDLKNYSTILSMPIPRLAKFLGFEFKAQSHTAVNHVEIYTPEKLEEVFLRLYLVDLEVKTSTRPLLIFEMFLSWFFTYMGV
ncbi:DNA polymerase III subunit delta [Pseudothermotoga thermarum]|uniref:DNA polymerase III delta n=1 Tax=Pseudothermotoga thermarum DSM 5069 TaxID=688269 RepID=F7YWU7_9THEM|nr:DNA polymerase III delta [Pseudothermotoga thermarum]AEH50457.1 DNA polymerase III delta [Pseudothermotoga thermarum DSM 5069]